MKPLKYTVAALALIAVASFTQSAKAQNQGDLVFGIYDANNTGLSNYDVDLGAFNSLSNGETFNLGTTVATQFAADSSANLVFNIAASGGAVGTGAEGLGKQEIAFTASSTPSFGTSTSTASSDITNLTNASENGTSISLPNSGTAFSLSGSTTGSFFNEIVTHTAYGLGSADIPVLEGSFANGTSVGLYTQVNNTGVATEIGTFSISDVGGDEVLTFDTLAAPEPSAYALGLCAVALFFVLKRRSSVA